MNVGYIYTVKYFQIQAFTKNSVVFSQRKHMGLMARKSVFRVSDKVTPKIAFAVTGIS